MSKALNDAAAPAELAAQITELQERLQSVQAAVDALQTASEYHPGDSLQITTVSLPGWLTTNATNLYADICLPKPIGSDVTSATLSGGNVVARGITGYLMGGSTGGDPLDEQSFIVAINMHGVRVRFTRSGGYDGTNNTPVVSEIAGATLTFH